MADGEVLEGCLVKAGYGIVKSLSKASVVVYNTCAVKGPTENRMIETLRRVPSKKKLVVAGCLPLINMERLSKEVRFDGVVGPESGARIVDVVGRVLKGERVVALEDALNAKPAFDLPRLRANPVISIIPISYGCLGSCAYCCVAFARGRVRSYDVEEIVQRVREDLASGVREFWLTSQDIACYGKDKDSNLAELLKAVSSVRGDFKIRVGMMTPNAAMDILDDLIEAFNDEHAFKFVHLPVQSGDDEVLKRMRRFYSVDDFRRVVHGFRAGFREMTLSTDVICGFPGESEEAFERTLRLIEEVQPDVVNVSKFFARPRTLAAEMSGDFVPLQEIRRRSGSAASIAKKATLEKNKHWIGWEGDMVIDEVGKVSGSWIGRNFAYKPIAVKCSDNLLSRTLRVKIVEAFSAYLKGEVIAQARQT